MKQYSQEERQAYMKEKAEQLESQITALAQTWRENPEKIEEYLKFQQQFHRYSARNCAMIYAQNPYASFVGSYKFYKDRGYYVQKGSTGLTVMVPTPTTFYRTKPDAPWKRVSDATDEQKRLIRAGALETYQKMGFRYGTVFDVSQTNIPREDYPKLLGLGYNSAQHSMIYAAVCSYAAGIGMPVVERDMQSVTLRGTYNHGNRQITINAAFGDTQKLSTLLHELAHGVLEHGTRRDLSVAHREFEADALSIMFNSAFNVEIPDARRSHLAENYRKLVGEIEAAGQTVDHGALFEPIQDAYSRYGEAMQNIANQKLGITEPALLSAAPPSKTQPEPVKVPEPKPRRISNAAEGYRMLQDLFPDLMSRKYTYMRLEAEAAMEPLSLEWLDSNTLSIMHTFVQNGDLMRDPEIVTRVDDRAKIVQPLSYRQDSLGLYQEVGVGRDVNIPLRAELNKMLAQWLHNVEQQGYYPVTATQLVNGENVRITFEEPFVDRDELKIPGMSAAEEIPTYRLYQLRPGDPDLFFNMNWLLSNGTAPEPSRYELVYEAPYNGETLDRLFARFNTDLPEDFTGRSMSVSDVVALPNEDGSFSAHFVDSVGFAELPNFVQELELPKQNPEIGIDAAVKEYEDMGFTSQLDEIRQGIETPTYNVRSTHPGKGRDGTPLVIVTEGFNTQESAEAHIREMIENSEAALKAGTEETQWMIEPNHTKHEIQQNGATVFSYEYCQGIGILPAAPHSRLFVDMDGTLAQFHAEDNYLERMWEPGFFENLKPYENAVEGLWQFMLQHPDTEVYILSSAIQGEPPSCAAQKNAWLDKHLPEIDAAHRLFPPVGEDKTAYIPGGVRLTDHLLDDYNKNLVAWRDAGGHAIKFVNHINDRGRIGERWEGDRVWYDKPAASICADLSARLWYEQPAIELPSQKQTVVANVPGSPSAEVPVVETPVVGTITYTYDVQADNYIHETVEYRSATEYFNALERDVDLMVENDAETGDRLIDWTPHTISSDPEIQWKAYVIASEIEVAPRNKGEFFLCLQEPKFEQIIQDIGKWEDEHLNDENSITEKIVWRQSEDSLCTVFRLRIDLQEGEDLSSGLQRLKEQVTARYEISTMSQTVKTRSPSPTSATSGRNYYDDAAKERIKAVPLEQLCSALGIETKRSSGSRLVCKIRDEKTSSCTLYPDNSFYDFGISEGGDNIRFVQLVKGCDFNDACDFIARQGGISPSKPSRKSASHKVNEKPRLSDQEYALIGINAAKATANFNLNVARYGAKSTAKFIAPYEDLTVQELRDQYPDVYTNVLKQRAIPFVYDLRNEYFRSLHSSSELARAVGSTLEANGEILQDLTKLGGELRQAEYALRDAAKGCDLKVPKPGDYDPVQDLADIESGKRQFEIGSVPYVELKKELGTDNRVAFQKVPYEDYRANNALADVRHAAFYQAGMVNVVYDRSQHKKLFPNMEISPLKEEHKVGKHVPVQEQARQREPDKEQKDPARGKSL